MNFSDVFRSFLGLSRNPSGADSFHNDFRNPIWNVDDDDDTDDELHHHLDGGNGNGNFQGGFQVFTNPLEMQRYFEQQMGEILKSFGGMIGTFGNEFSPPSMNEQPHFGLPSIREKREGCIRDEYLKPGYRSPDLSQRKNKMDSDLDGKVTSDDLNSLFDKKFEGSSQSNPTEGTSKLEKYNPRDPNPSEPKQRSTFYGQTFMRKSVLLPDGSIETTQTMKNSDGQEETTVTISPGRSQSRSSNMGALTEPFDSMWSNFFGR